MSPIRLTPLAMLVAMAIASHYASAESATTDPAGTIAAAADVAPGTAESATLDPVTVTAIRLKNARIELSPKVGTTVYTIDTKTVDALGQGADTSFDEVLLHLPGVDKDSKASGSLHVRDDHGNVQYRVNGVQLPENISGFGTSIDTRFVDRIDFLTGALPAQYGLRTAGIVEIETKEGKITPGGEISLGFGSHSQFEPSAQVFGSVGSLTYYLSGSYLSNNQGIENPLPTSSASHDKTEQDKSFGALSYYLDDSSRLGLIFGTYNGKFQIPTNPDQPFAYSLAGYSDTVAGTNSYPSNLVNENQTEVNRFVVGSYQQTFGDFDYQVSVFHQYSDLHFTPDPIGDLIFNGVASDTLRSNTANGLQFDSSYKLNAAHTLRAGGGYTRQTTTSNNTVGVFAVDAGGTQVPPFKPVSIIDDSSKVGRLSSLYVQDEFHIDPKLTLNYGVRFDTVDAFVNERQWSPRLNAAYKLTEDTFVHAGFSRYFTPPPQELASQQSINLYTGTSNQPAVTTSDNVKAERTSYWDLGVGHKVTEHLTVAVDAYYKQITNLIDEGQFGQALILSPFNYAQGHAHGVELSTTYNASQWSGYANLAYQKAQGTNIISGQSLFGPDELAYIASHYIYLDHDQTYTASGGVSYRFDDSQVSLDGIFGSGLRRTGDNGIPNGDSLPQYTVVNTAFSHTWKVTPVGELDGRLALLNVFDKVYLLRDGTGVGVGAPQFGVRRTVYGGISLKF